MGPASGGSMMPGGYFEIMQENEKGSARDVWKMGAGKRENCMNHRLVPFSVLIRTQDPQGCASGIALGADYAVTYGFDAQGRFSTVTASVGSATSTFTYTYVQGSDLLAGWTSNHGTSHARTFEPNRNQITGIQNQHGTNLISSFDYTNDG